MTHTPTCTAADSDIVLIPAGESVEFFPLNRIDADLAFVVDSWDSAQFFPIQPQLAPVTVVGDELVVKWLVERFSGGVFDQQYLHNLNVQIARAVNQPISVVEKELAKIDMLRLSGASIVLTSALRVIPTQTRQQHASVKQMRASTEASVTRKPGGQIAEDKQKGSTVTATKSSGGSFTRKKNKKQN